MGGRSANLSLTSRSRLRPRLAPSDWKAAEEPRGLGRGRGTADVLHLPAPASCRPTLALENRPLPGSHPGLPPRWVPVLPSFPSCESPQSQSPPSSAGVRAPPSSPPRRPWEPSAYSPAQRTPSLAKPSSKQWIAGAPNLSLPASPCFLQKFIIPFKYMALRILLPIFIE